MTLVFTRDVRRRIGAALAVLVLGLAALKIVGGGPVRSLEGVAPAASTEPLRGVVTSHKALALTFDISWGTIMPPKVIAILREAKVPATFFLSGPWAANHPEIVKELLRDGFEVESHGAAHVNFSSLSAEGVSSNIRSAGDALIALGAHPSFIRPPNGDYSPTSLKVAAQLGYTTVIWGTDSIDWMNPGVATIEGRVLKRAHPGDIILMHASDTCKQTDLALPTIIRGLRKDGYQLLTLKNLLKLQGTS